MIRYQFYLPNWWKLWPTYRSYVDFDYGYTAWFFCFGPFQFRGYR